VLLDPDRTLHGTRRPIHRLVGREDRHFLEDQAGDVLGAVDVPDPGIGRHDHPCGPIATGQPGAFVVRHDPVLVVVHLLAHVPHGSVVSLCVEVDGHLEDAAVEVRHVLRLDDVDLLAVPLDHAGRGEQGHFRPQRFATVLAELDDL